MLILQTSVAFLDEIDIGLDIDALKCVAENINSLRSENFSGLIITHYQRLLDYIHLDKVHVLENVKIITSGGSEIVQEFEKKYYAFLDWEERS
jgi:Fe-S cluster assembly ATP-binding protein